MAHNLKLEIFRISLKKKGGSRKNLINYQEFFENAFSKTDKNDSYKEFINKFILLFGNEFKLNADNTKAISATKDKQFNFRSNTNVIDGEIIGGTTGIDQTLYKRKNSKKGEGNITTDTVSALPFFIKLWTPMDHNTGVLMIQSYSNHTVTEMVKSYLSKFFQDYNYSIIITPYIPNAIKEKYRNNSSVYKVALIRESLTKNKRKLLNPLFTEFEGLKVRIEISGFTEKSTEFWKKFTGNNKLISSNLEDFDIKEDDDFKTIAYYKDDHGHKSKTSMEKQVEIKPTIFLDDSMKRQNSEHFDFDKIRNHTDGLLNDIRKEIGYDSQKS